MPKLVTFPLVAPIDVVPQPIPTQFGVKQIRHNGEIIVALQIATAVGVQMVFLDPNTAQQVARMLQEASGGIVIAPAMPEGTLPQ